MTFDTAIIIAMRYEVGRHFRLTPEVEAGLIKTREQRRAVGYVNDRFDRGGETKFGVSKNANPDLNITTLTWQQAKEVYYRRYWLAASCDKLPQRLAILHFDGAVNHGVRRANMILQKAVGVTEDGVIGPMTLSAVNQMDEYIINGMVCKIREEYYHAIVRRNPSQERFLRGWLSRIEHMAHIVGTRIEDKK